MDHDILKEMFSVRFYIWTYTKELAFRTIPSLLILKIITIYDKYAKDSLQKLYVVS